MLLLYIWKLELPCAYFTSVCVADVRIKFSKSTDVVIRANVCLWVFCRHLDCFVFFFFVLKKKKSYCHVFV